MDLAYVSTHLGAANGTLVLRVEQRASPHAVHSAVRGVGGGAKLCVAPLLLEFGKHAVGTRTDSQVTVRNCGGPGGRVHRRLGDPARRGGLPVPARPPVAYPVTLTTGTSVAIPVSFVPTTSGDVVEQLQIVTSLAGGTVNVQLQSTAAELRSVQPPGEPPRRSTSARWCPARSRSSGQRCSTPGPTCACSSR